jgi:flagellar assembly factor FliW
VKELETTRFGRIPFLSEKVLTFPEGLLGFPKHSRFYLLETAEPSVFFWLQSVEDPSLAFVVMDPDDLVSGYGDRIRSVIADPAFRDQEFSAMVIVTVPSGNGGSMTANLQGPLVVRQSDRIGRQVVLFDEESWLHFPLFSTQSRG